MSDKRSTYVYPIDSKGEITAHINSFIVSQESFASSIGMELGIDGMRPYFLHLDNAELAARHPNEVRKVAPVEPIRPLVDDPNFMNAFKIFETDERKFNLYQACVLTLISAFFDMMIESDQQLIRAIDPINGQSSVTLNIMYKFVMTHYGQFTDTAQGKLRSDIEGTLSLSESLESNLTRMQVSNSVLISHGAGLGYSENLMFKFAFDKLKANPRTKDIADDFKKRDGYVPSTATFTDLKKYVIAQYDVRSPPLSTASYAFANETREDIIEPFAAAAIPPTKNDAPTREQFDALVAQLEALRSNQTRTAHLPQNSTPVPAPGYCILCGFGVHGPGLTSRFTSKPSYCRRMADKDGNPRPGTPYTKEQILCKNSKGAPIAGMPRCQNVKQGFTKP